MLYLIESFKEDSKVKNNPPLSEEGVVFGKKLKLRNNAIKFDLCYASYLLSDFGSALIITGDKLIVNRTHSLDNKNKEEIINFIKSLPNDKKVLIVAKNDVISIIKDNFVSMILK